MMLTRRREDILRIIVGEYISTATPVGSMSVVRRHRLPMSPATVRSEMGELEEEGYVARPHTSAGRVPLDKGYRYYVDALMEDVEVPIQVQRIVRHQFHQVERDLEEWTHLAASILAQMAQNVAMATLPKAREPRLKHVELISLQDFLALLVLVLREARLRRQMVALDEAASQEELSVIAHRLTAAFGGLTGAEIEASEVPLSAVEGQVVRAVLSMMGAEDEGDCEEPCLTGVRHILRQPEFASGTKAGNIVAVFEEGSLLKLVLSRMVSGEGARVVIGGENQEETMRDLSLVVTRYGIPGQFTGVLGVAGPTRMPYAQTISIVRFLASVMSEVVAEVCR